MLWKHRLVLFLVPQSTAVFMLPLHILRDGLSPHAAVGRQLFRCQTKIIASFSITEKSSESRLGVYYRRPSIYRFRHRIYHPPHPSTFAPGHYGLATSAKYVYTYVRYGRVRLSISPKVSMSGLLYECLLYVGFRKGSWQKILVQSCLYVHTTYGTEVGAVCYIYILGKNIP